MTQLSVMNVSPDGSSSDMPSALRWRPQGAWRLLRVFSQTLAWIALILTPLLGGLRRVDAAALSAWDPPKGWGFSQEFFALLPEFLSGRSVDAFALRGGGMGVDYLGVPMIDPVAGTMSLFFSIPSLKAAVALILPLLAALFFGRVFCGWFCPFGSLSRVLRAVHMLLPSWWPRFSIGPRRPIRFVLLVLIFIGGAFGSQVLLTMTLPHLVLSQTVYSYWLLGGGGALVGWLAALVALGLFFGPTTYCTTLCPTGGFFSLFGRFRAFRLRIEKPSACGPCTRCDDMCWLSLKPSTGDAGADCDSCGRCSMVCPHDNLRIGRGRGALKVLAGGGADASAFVNDAARPKVPSAARTAVLVLCVVASGALAPSPAHAQTGHIPYVKPALLLDAYVVSEDVNVAIGVLDTSRVRLNADTATTVGGTELNVRAVRGPRAEKDSMGREGSREHYAGPMTLYVERDGTRIAEVAIEKPNSPRSTVRRKVYKTNVPALVQPGDVVGVAPLAQWTTKDVRITVPESAPGRDKGALDFFLAGLLLLTGLFALSFLASGRGDTSA